MKVNLKDLAFNYSENRPFPHVIVKDWWSDKLLSKVADEYKSFADWDHIKNSTGTLRKRSCGTPGKFPPATKELISCCNSVEFLRVLEAITGERGLIPDPYFLGGGMHSSTNGGFLGMHIDFNWHKHMRVYRRLNLLIYLNSKWDEDWGGSCFLLIKRKLLEGEVS